MEVNLEVQQQRTIKVIMPVALMSAGLVLASYAAFFGFLQSQPAKAISCATASTTNSPTEEQTPDSKLARGNVDQLSKKIESLAIGDVTKKFKDKKYRGQLQASLIERKQAWQQLAATDPVGAMLSSLSQPARQALGKYASGCVEQMVAVEGVINVRQLENFAKTKSVGVLEYELVTDQNTQHVHFARGLRENLISGTRVRLKGLVMDNDIVLDGTASAEQPNGDLGGLTVVGTPGTTTVTSAGITSTSEVAGAPWDPIPGTNRTIVLLTNFLDSNISSPTVSQVNDTMFNQINSYYQENSYNQTTVEGEARDWMTIDINRTCNYSLITSYAVAKAEQLDPNLHLKDFGHIIIIAPLLATPGIPCYDGASYIGRVLTATRDGLVTLSQAWVKDTYANFYTLAHEYGHGLGANHAAFKYANDALYGPGGYAIWMYGDLGDLMGANGLYGIIGGQFNVYHKDLMTWAAGNNIALVDRSGSYELEPLETASTGYKMLKLQRSATEYLWVENRQPIGYDIPLDRPDFPNFFDGATLYIHEVGAANDSLQLDATSPGDGDTLNISLPIGSTYTDPATGNSLTIASRTPEGNLVIDVTVVADFNPPTVSITNPTEGQPVTGAVMVQTNADDNIALDRVEFFVSNPANVIATRFATVTVAPYEASFDSTTVVNGTTYLRAVAYDTSGKSTTSQIVTVSVSNLPPAVTIVAPAVDSVVTGQITVNAITTPGDVGQDVVSVSVYNYGLSQLPLTTDITAPYDLPIDTTTFTNGPQQLVVKATDIGGQIGQKSIRVFSLNQSATPSPYVYLAEPTDLQTLTGISHFQAAAVDQTGISQVRFYAGSPSTPQLLGADATAPYELNVDTTTIPGTSTLVWAQVENTSLATADSLTKTVNLLNPMSVTMSAPQANQTLSGTVTVTAQANAYGDGWPLSAIEYFVSLPVYGDVSLGQATVAPYDLSVDTKKLPNGNAFFWARASYQVGTGPMVVTKIDSIWVPTTLDNPENPSQPPQITLTSPTPDMFSADGRVDLSADASDNEGVARVDYYLDFVTPSGPYPVVNTPACVIPFNQPVANYYCQITVATGTHRVKAVVTDFSGLTTESIVVTFTAYNPLTDSLVPKAVIDLHAL